jgi:threonine dehydrogenase-like Zn-dependent dehydrogenase
VTNKGLTLRSAQQHGERYIPMLLERMAGGELKTAYLATHPMPLDESPGGYDLFMNKQDGCVRSVFQPDTSACGAVREVRVFPTWW